MATNEPADDVPELEEDSECDEEEDPFILHWSKPAGRARPVKKEAGS